MSQYNIQVDPSINPISPTKRELLEVGESVGESTAVELKPELKSIDDDIGAVSRQIRELPIDKLINETTSMYNVPLFTATPNIYAGAAGSSYSLVNGTLQIDWIQPVPDDVADANLSLEGMVPIYLKCSIYQ